MAYLTALVVLDIHANAFSRVKAQRAVVTHALNSGPAAGG